MPTNNTKKFSQQDIKRLKEVYPNFDNSADNDIEWVRLMNHRSVLLFSGPGDYFIGTITVPFDITLEPLESERLYSIDNFEEFGFDPYEHRVNFWQDPNEKTA